MTARRGVLNLRCPIKRPKASRCWRIVWYGVLIAVAWSAAVRPAASADGSADQDKPMEKFEKNFRKAFEANKMQFSGGGQGLRPADFRRGALDDPSRHRRLLRRESQVRRRGRLRDHRRLHD